MSAIRIWLHGVACRGCWFILAAICVVWIVNSAFGQTGQHGDGHGRWHHYYQHWKQPGTGTSCCNARVIGLNGEDLTGDCEPTRAEIRNGQWWAWLRQQSRWIPIPDAKIIRERNPSIEEAHLCWQPWSGVLCFVPPDTGG